MNIFTRMLRSIGGHDYQERKRKEESAKLYKDLRENLGSGVEEILKIWPIGVRDSSVAGILWSRIWISVYLIDNPYSGRRIDTTITKLNGDELWRVMCDEWPAYSKLVKDDSTPFGRHVSALREGYHPWAGRLLNLEDFTADDVQTAQYNKIERIIETVSMGTPLETILGTMRRYVRA